MPAHQMSSRSRACVRQATGTGGADPTQVLSGTERYGSGAIAFHWIMVPLIVVVGVLGLLHDSWPKRTQGFWINIHALVGLLVWVSLIARFWWRSRHPPPALPQDVGEISRHLSSSVHMLLYALIFIIPVIGVVTFVWHGRAFDFGLFQVNFGIRSNKAIFHPTEDIHGYLAYALFALAGMHVLAAVWHHLIRRDDVLRRMWPNLRKRRLARR
jgi:cytochrome b561